MVPKSTPTTYFFSFILTPLPFSFFSESELQIYCIIDISLNNFPGFPINYVDFARCYHRIVLSLVHEKVFSVISSKIKRAAYYVNAFTFFVAITSNTCSTYIFYNNLSNLNRCCYCYFFNASIQSKIFPFGIIFCCFYRNHIHIAIVDFYD